VKIFIVYDQLDTRAAQEPPTLDYPMERRAADIIDGDQQDCLVIWRSIIGESGNEREVLRITATGVYENLSAPVVTKLVEDIEQKL
jgi:hypothetical protein